MQWLRPWQQLLTRVRWRRQGRCVRSWQRRLQLEQLERRLPPAVHDTLATAIHVSFHGGQSALFSGDLTNANQVDLYAVTLAAGQQVTANVSAQRLGSPLNAALRIFNAVGRQLTLDADGRIGLDPVLSYDARTTGTYYIGVSSTGNLSYDPTTTASGQYGGTTGSYALNVSVVTPATIGENNTLSTAEIITGSTNLTGSLQAGDTDFFQLTVEDTGRLVVTATASDAGVLQTRLSLYDGTGKFLIQSDAVAVGDPSAELDQHLQVGTYFLAVSAVRNTTNATADHGYQLTTRFDPAGGPFAAIPPEQAPFTHSVAVADLTGDGKQDIITANYSAGTVSVLLGNGDGTFQPAATYSCGPSTEPDFVAVADLTGDGRPDIITANSNGSSVSVLMGNGDGTFQPAYVYPVYWPTSIAVADINGDGKPDIIATSPYRNSVSVLLGNGDGTFKPATALGLPKGTYPSSVAVADLTGDGRPDIITANGSLYSYFRGRNGGSSVSVLLGNGDGTFQPARTVTLPAGIVPFAVAVTDLTANGIPDIITANFGVNKGSTGNGTVDVLLGNGDGTFKPPVSFPVGPKPYSVAVADLTGDGIPDIITANDDENGSVSVLLGNGKGTFKPATSFPVGPSPDSVAVADLTGDGIPDIITSNENGSVSVLLGNGNGTFQPAASIPVGSKPYSVAVADLTGDGIPDIITANKGSYNVSVLLGNGDGSFQPPPGQTSIPSQDVPRLALIGRDSIPDALSLDQNTGQILFRAGTGNSSEPYAPFVIVNPDHPATAYTLVQTANFNQPEIAALDAVADTVYLYAWTGSNPQQPFQLRGSFPTGGGPVRIASDDLNGDGLGDLVVANSFDDTVTIAFQQASGSFSGILTRPIGSAPSSISFADVAGRDGPDIVVSDQVSGDVTVLINDPNHTFAGESRYRAGPGLFDIASSPTAGTIVYSNLQTVGVVAAPFTGTGLPDLLAVNAETDSFSLLSNLGGGSFADPQAGTTFPLGSVTAVQALVGDFTPYTTFDLAILTTSASGVSQVRIYLNNGDGTFGPPIISDAGLDATGFSFLPAPIGPALHPYPAELLIGNAYGDILTLTGDGTGNFAVDRSSLVGKPLAVGQTAAGQTFVVQTNTNLGQVQVFYQKPGVSPSGSSPFDAPVTLTATASASPLLLAPGAVQLADLDNDGNLDLIVADRLGNDVLVYFGNAYGSFDSTPYSIPVGFEPSAITVGDFNGDGVLDLAVANQGSNDVSVLMGHLTNGVWTATHGPRLSSGGSQPIAVTAGNFIHKNFLDLRVTNAGGQLATLPGIGTTQGTGFFDPPQTTDLGSTIVQAAYDPSTGAEFFVLADGSLRSLDGAVEIASGVVAVSAADGVLAAGLANGGVEVLTESGAELGVQFPSFSDEPSALDALQNGSQIDVYASYQGQDAPLLFTFTGSFVIPVITELPATAAVAQVTRLTDTNLILVGVLLQGSLVEQVPVVTTEPIPSPETFSVFVETQASSGSGLAPYVEEPVGRMPLPADVPLEVQFQAFRLGVEEALQQRRLVPANPLDVDALPTRPPQPPPAPMGQPSSGPNNREETEDQEQTGQPAVGEVELAEAVDVFPQVDGEMLWQESEALLAALLTRSYLEQFTEALPRPLPPCAVGEAVWRARKGV